MLSDPIVDRLQMDWNSDLLFRPELLERIRESGRHVAKMAAAAPEERTYIGEPGHCPVCHNDVMVLSQDSADVCCSVCGIHGTLSVADGRIVVTYTQEELSKSHIKDSGRKIHLADLQENARVKESHTPQEWTSKKRELCDDIKTVKPEK